MLQLIVEGESMEEEESGERRTRGWGASKNGRRKMDEHSYIKLIIEMIMP